MTDIFLSYARADRDRILPIVAQLEEYGWTVWWDSKIGGGERWDSTIEANLDGAQCVIVAWSEASVGSQWVRTEANEGQKKSALIPVTIDGTEPPLAFRLIQTIDLQPFIDSQDQKPLDMLKAAVAQLVAPKKPTHIDPPKPPRLPLAQFDPTLALDQADRIRPSTTMKSKGGNASRRATSLLLALGLCLAVAVVSGVTYYRFIRSPSDAELKTLASFADCSACPEMVVLPTGSFQLTDAMAQTAKGEPARRIVISYRFAIGKTEVTNEMFAPFLSALIRNGDFDPGLVKTTFDTHDSRLIFSVKRILVEPGYEKHPVTNVSWRGASAYAKWLSGLTGKKYRLPSESEWEYAARAGDKKDFIVEKKSLDELCLYANVPDKSAAEVRETGYVLCEDGYANTAPVGHFRANAFNIHDAIGNVWEWTDDCYVKGISSTPQDGRPYSPNPSCAERVIKGGAHDHIFYGYSGKFQNSGNGTISTLGFRLVRELSQ